MKLCWALLKTTNTEAHSDHRPGTLKAIVDRQLTEPTGTTLQVYLACSTAILSSRLLLTTLQPQLVEFNRFAIAFTARDTSA